MNVYIVHLELTDPDEVSAQCCYSTAPVHRSRITNHLITISRRGGRAVDRAGLENRKAERPREFESHPLRMSVPVCDCRFSICRKRKCVTSNAHKIPSTAAQITSDR